MNRAARDTIGQEIEVRLPGILEPITAWRVWNVQRELFGLFYWLAPFIMTHKRSIKYSWREPRRAECINGFCGISAPSYSCQCGFYGCKDPESALTISCGREEIFAFGKTTMWGEVIEHENGYRAQFAAPLLIMLVCPRREQKLATRFILPALRRHYKIPISIYTYEGYAHQNQRKIKKDLLAHIGTRKPEQ